MGVVAFAFGSPASIHQNRHIAKGASECARKFGATVYTQHDIWVDDDVESEWIQENPGEPPPTLRIARGAVQWAKREEIKCLWVVAAEPHVWRCLRDLHYAIQEAGLDLEVHDYGPFIPETEANWLGADPQQTHPKSWFRWQIREFIIQWMPFWLYKRVAA